MGRPITTTAGGICFAFPNVCNTSTPAGLVPIPYPSIGQLSDAGGTSKVLAGGKPVVRQADTIAKTSGDAAGQAGVISGTIGGKVEFVSASQSVFADGSPVVRMFDQTSQNDRNATGVVLGGFPRVLAGG
jgi:uncharacterized Zn-binding protein involved in type VI secretion